MKLRFGLVLTSAITLGLGACAGGGGASAAAIAPQVSGGTELATGERVRNNDHTRAAQRHLDQAASAGTPDEAMAHYQAAVESALAGIEADPTNPLSHRQAAEAYIGVGDYEAAGAAFDEAERLRPIYTIETERIREETWIERYQAAAPLVNAGQYEAAVEYFEQANAVYKGRPEVMLYLGQIYAQVGEYDKAIENLSGARDMINSEKIEEMDSATAANWREQGAGIPTMIAQSLVNAERYDEAVVALQELIVEEPNNPSYLRTLGTTYVRMGDTEGARGVYEQMMAMEGLESNEYYQVGIGLYQLEDYAGAANAFRTAAEASVNDRDAVEMWARSLQIANPQGGDAEETPAETLQEMLAAAERWRDLDPNNEFAYLVVAQAANRLGDGQTAGAMIAEIEGLTIKVDQLQLQRYPNGGGVIGGLVRNVSADPGATVTVEVTLYAADGSVIGTESARVQLGAAEEARDFRIDVDSTQYIGGYSYRVVM